MFAYLAIVPAGLVVSTLDSACSGPECETSLASDVLLVVLYAASFAGVAGTSAALSLYAFAPSVGRERLIRRALVIALAAIALTLFALFALAFPIAALATFGTGAVVYAGLRYLNRSRSPDPSRNGHGRLNGHPG